MQPFKQTESAYTETAKTIVFSGSSNYDPAKLDNPVRKKINFAIALANFRSFKREVS